MIQWLLDLLYQYFIHTTGTISLHSGFDTGPANGVFGDAHRQTHIKGISKIITTIALKKKKKERLQQLPRPADFTELSQEVTVSDVEAQPAAGSKGSKVYRSKNLLMSLTSSASPDVTSWSRISYKSCVKLSFYRR